MIQNTEIEEYIQNYLQDNKCDIIENVIIDAVKWAEDKCDTEKAYLYAELDNQQKRFAKRSVEICENATKEAICSLLSVIDDLEMAYRATKSEGHSTLLNVMKSRLKDSNIEMFGEEGDVFDDSLHNAVYGEPYNDESQYNIGEISKVIKSGYKYNGKVIRYAQVIVVIE